MEWEKAEREKNETNNEPVVCCTNNYFTKLVLICGDGKKLETTARTEGRVLNSFQLLDSV